MDARKEELLMKLVDQHVASATPVSSGLLVDKYDLDYSSATVRNDMASLEEDGLISQPHTSAGRVPTEEGYRHYVRNITPSKLAKREELALGQAIESGEDYQRAVKNMARALAELSCEAVVVAWGKNDVYYTGISNLFSKPEFADQNMVQNLSAMLDRFDSVVADLLSRFDNEEVTVLIGSENPFSSMCSTVGFRHGEGAVMLLGPMRMKYGDNIALMRKVRSLVGGSCE